jgi:yecA family protein
VDLRDEKPSSLDRLWDPQADKLTNFVEEHYDPGAMDLEELDGFFAASHCCLEIVPLSEYLPVVLGEVSEQGFRSLQEAQQAMRLILMY